MLQNPLSYHPPVGFHFAVAFEIPALGANDFRFREVSGLSASVETENLREGGENRFSHELPTGVSYEKLVLKRGLVFGSAFFQWCRLAIETFQFAPVNATITLLNELHVPVAAWYVVNAYPIRWTVSDFNAEESSIVVESIELNYNYFKSIRI